VKGANLALRFGLELTALAIAAWWGATVGSGVWAWVLAVAAPLAIAVVWGMFVAPKRRIDLPHPARFAIEVLVWLTAAGALWNLGHEFLASLFLSVAIVSGALNVRWG
jgi:hypothetical protein